MMKRITTVVVVLLALFWIAGGFLFHSYGNTQEADAQSAPVKGMITMIDLGAKACIPCKMMIPVMESVEKKYKGKAAVLFFDVWKDKAPAERFGIRAIPTQIFFDREGKEMLRHEGFMSEAEIDRVFDRMGVRLDK